MASFKKIVKQLKNKLLSRPGLLISLSTLLAVTGIILSFTGIGTPLGLFLLNLGASQMAAQIATTAVFGLLSGLVGAGIAAFSTFIINKCRPRYNKYVEVLGEEINPEIFLTRKVDALSFPSNEYNKLTITTQKPSPQPKNTYQDTQDTYIFSPHHRT